MLTRKAQRNVRTALLDRFKASRDNFSACCARKELTALHLGQAAQTPVLSAPQERLLPRLARSLVPPVLQANSATRAPLNATNVRRELGAQPLA